MVVLRQSGVSYRWRWRRTQPAFPYGSAGLPRIRKIPPAKEKTMVAIPRAKITRLGTVQHRARQFRRRGLYVSRQETMHLRDVLKPGIKIAAGSFNQDARGRWYINVPIELECGDRAPNTRVGIDSVS